MSMASASSGISSSASSRSERPESSDKTMLLTSHYAVDDAVVPRSELSSCHLSLSCLTLVWMGTMSSFNVCSFFHWNICPVPIPNARHTVTFISLSVVFDRRSILLGSKSYWMLLKFWIPGHFVFLTVADVERRHAMTVMYWVDLAAFTKSELVTQSFFSLMNRRIFDLVTAAILSHGPLPDCASEKSMRRTKTPVAWYSFSTESSVSEPL